MSVYISSQCLHLRVRSGYFRDQFHTSHSFFSSRRIFIRGIYIILRLRARSPMWETVVQTGVIQSKLRHSFCLRPPI